MGTVTCQISISLDGFVAGPNQSLENPIGEGGMRLHDWVFATAGWRRQHGEQGGDEGVDSEVVDEVTHGVGAYIMGRHMFGGGSGPWDPEWRGWWGDDPPYHAPVFVLTHHARQPLRMAGGTMFTFVTDGIASALDQAQAAAGGRFVLPAAPIRFGSTWPQAASTSCTCISSLSFWDRERGCSRASEIQSCSRSRSSPRLR